MNKCIFSLEAVGIILAESFRYENAIETGGILIGPKSNKNIITAAIPSTCHAERRSMTYFQSEEDIKILNAELREYQLKGFDYRGDWHRHPHGMSTLSDGDEDTCKEIFADSNYKVDNYLIMCVVTETPNLDFPVFTYEIKFMENKELSVEKIEMEVLPMKCIEHFLECFKTMEVNDESNNHGHPAGTIERKPERRAIWSKIRQNDIMLPRDEKRLGKTRSIEPAI